MDKYDFEELGRLLHRLGDSFAHRNLDGSGFLYGKEDTWTPEHFIPHQSAPDLIMNRPSLYKEYVNQLEDVLIEKYDDRTKIDKPQLWEKIHDLTTYAVINKVSLLGIINYEVSKLIGEKTFIIHLNYSYLPTAADHKKIVNNTIQYLHTLNVSFSYNKIEGGTLFTIEK